MYQASGSITYDAPDSKSLASLAMKISQVMGDVPAIPKRGYNKQFDFHYHTAEDIFDGVRQSMAHVGLAMFCGVESVEHRYYTTSRGVKMMRVFATFRFTLICGDTGAMIHSLWEGMADNNGDKAMNMAVVAAEKYFLKSVFLIATLEDDTEAQETPERRTSLSIQVKTLQDKPDVIDKLVLSSRNAGYIPPTAGEAELLALINEKDWTRFQGAKDAGAYIMQIAERDRVTDAVMAVESGAKAETPVEAPENAQSASDEEIVPGEIESPLTGKNAKARNKVLNNLQEAAKRLEEDFSEFPE